MGLDYILSPQGFLKIGGVILVLIAVLGFIGVIGPSSDTLFGGYWYFDNAENWAHLVLGIAALVAVFWFPASFNKMLVMALGVIGVLIGLYSLFSPSPEGTDFMGAMLQNPADTLLHLIVGAWALVAGFKKGGTMM